MGYRIPPLAALRAFESAARHLSFKRAADELHVTPAAVSQQIKFLEDQLGLPLFRRLTRSLELTESGKVMLPKIREGLDCLKAAVDSVRHSAQAGPLTVNAPPNFAARWLLPRLHRFTGAYPEVELRVSSNADAIDTHAVSARSAESRSGREDFDVEVRFGTGRYPGTRVDRIFGVSYVAVCSPHLLEGPHPVRGPEDLKHQVLIHDDTIPDLAERPRWSDWLEAAGVKEVDGSRGPHFSNSGLALEAAMDGLGFALALQPLAGIDVASGRLAIPFDVTLPSNYAYFLVSPQAVADRPAVRAFRTWVLKEAEPTPQPTSTKTERRTRNLRAVR